VRSRLWAVERLGMSAPFARRAAVGHGNGTGSSLRELAQIGGQGCPDSESGPQQDGIVLRPESWLPGSREDRDTGGPPEHPTLDDLARGRETSLALLARRGDGTCVADVIRRFHRPAHDPAIVHSRGRALTPGRRHRARALWLNCEVAGLIRRAEQAGRGRRHEAVWLRLGTWDAAWGRRSAIRFGHSRPGRARS
jgi:hypothetical protein